jgi:hypothetical protein
MGPRLEAPPAVHAGRIWPIAKGPGKSCIRPCRYLLVLATVGFAFLVSDCNLQSCLNRRRFH